MIFRALIEQEFQNRKNSFKEFVHHQTESSKQYVEWLQLLNADSVSQAFSNNHEIGALPSREFYETNNIWLPFSHDWKFHNQSRQWAMDVLLNRTTFAADGSEFNASNHLNIPVALIQIGTYESFHNQAGDYRKNVVTDILTPAELSYSADQHNTADTVIKLKRFENEVDALCEFIERSEGWQQKGERMPVAFFDGTFLISFSIEQTDIHAKFIEYIFRLLDKSKKCRVPVVGYIAGSIASDVVTLLDNVNNQFVHNEGLTDAFLLDQLLTYETSKTSVTTAVWGNRTTFNYCHRKNLSKFYCKPVNDLSSVGFIYLKNAVNGMPARIDIPSWVYEDDLLNELTNVIRAECIVGMGYPYALEAADSAAVISASDSHVFLNSLLKFSETENIDIQLASKMKSKSRRR